MHNPYNITATDLGLNGSKDLGGGIVSVVNILTVLIGMLAIIFMIVGGLQMTLSSGNPKRFAQGRETLIYAGVGLVVAIAAFAIVTFVTGSVK